MFGDVFALDRTERARTDMQRDENTMLIVVTHSPELARTLPRQQEMVDGTLEEWRP